MFYIPGFAQETVQYAELYVASFLTEWSYGLAWGVCVVEIMLGIGLWIRPLRMICSVVILLRMSFFLYITGVNYFSPTIFESIESCGCFGELIHFSPLGSFIKTLGLWVMIVGVNVIEQYEKKH